MYRFLRGTRRVQTGPGLNGFLPPPARGTSEGGSVRRPATPGLRHERMLPDLLSRLFRRIIAHVDVPGEVGPYSGRRTGIYAFEIGEQVRTQPVNLAAGFQ
jgi:hypothetical protein